MTLVKKTPQMKEINILYHGVMKHCIKSPVSGAQTSLYCAVETDIENLSGKYFRYMKHLMYTKMPWKRLLILQFNKKWGLD